MKAWPWVLVSLVFSGCATPAFRAVEQECMSAAWVDYPAQKIEMVQQRQRVIQVATGMRSCYTTRDGAHAHTICNDTTRPEFINYQERVVIDQNEAVRNMAIASCSANLCLQRYGNALCKTDQVLVPVK